MRLRRFGVSAAAVAALGLLGTACTPPNELENFSIDKSAEVSSDGHYVTLRGNISCERPGNVDLFTDFNTDFEPDVTPTIQCEGPEIRRWSAVFHDPDDTEAKGGSAYVTIQAWLWQTGEPEDNDDSVTVSRQVTYS